MGIKRRDFIKGCAAVWVSLLPGITRAANNQNANSKIPIFEVLPGRNFENFYDQSDNAYQPDIKTYTTGNGSHPISIPD